MVREFLTTVTPDELATTRQNPWAPEYPETTLSCLQVILEEEWEHHRYAVRDLDTDRRRPASGQPLTVRRSADVDLPLAGGRSVECRRNRGGRSCFQQNSPMPGRPARVQERADIHAHRQEIHPSSGHRAAVGRLQHPETNVHRERADKIYLHLLATNEQLAPEVASYARTSQWYHQPAASLQMMMLLELN